MESVKTRLWYQNYLNGHWWKFVKGEVKKREGKNCSMLFCRQQKVEFHHLSYRHLYSLKEIQEVVSVCRLHHRLCHYKWFFRVKIPLEEKPLTNRYKSLRWQFFRRIKPSDILYFIYATFQT